jgi:hypothetical protein
MPKENYMSSIILPNEEPKEETKELQEATQEPEYTPTEEDEEIFFCIYHMSIQPTEANNLSPAYRKWLIMRFIAQKNMEQEAIQRQKLMQKIGPDLKF